MRIDPVLVAPDAVTATTTFEPINVANAKKVTLMFTRADHDSGSTAFTVTGSIDGTTFITLNNLIDNVTNTNAQGYTRVGSVTLSADGSKIYSIDLEMMSLKEIKVTATETTDGTHSYKALIEY